MVSGAVDRVYVHQLMLWRTAENLLDLSDDAYPRRALWPSTVDDTERLRDNRRYFI